MNLKIVIPIIIFIIMLISVIVFILYKKSYKVYNTELTINVKITEPPQEATFKKILTLTNPETENVYTTLQNLGSEVRGEEHLENEQARTIKINLDFKNNLDSYILLNTMVDELKKLNIVEMNYEGNIFDSTIRNEYKGKFKENNGKIVIDNMNLNVIYTKEFKEYKVVDSKSDNKDYIEGVEKQTEDMVNEANNAGDVSNSENSEPNENPENEPEPNENSEPEPENPEPEPKENFDAETIDLRIKNEKRNGDFVLYENQPQMSLHIVLFNIKSNDTIKETQKEINYPIFTYSAYKDIQDKTDIILEPYKGMISRKTSNNGTLNYELHYHSSKSIETDYKKILEEVNKSFDVLMLNYTPTNQLLIYQSSDTIKVKRYIKQLEQQNIKIVDDDNIKMANVNKLPCELFK